MSLIDAFYRARKLNNQLERQQEWLRSFNSFDKNRPDYVYRHKVQTLYSQASRTWASAFRLLMYLGKKHRFALKPATQL